jgi:hypothetical protein
MPTCATAPAMNRGSADEAQGGSRLQCTTPTDTALLDARRGPNTFGVTPTLPPMAGEAPCPGNVGALGVRRSFQRACACEAHHALKLGVRR